jgi:hypothetical protein
LLSRDADLQACAMRADLRDELLRRAERDQTARAQAEHDWELVAAVDAENIAWLKDVIAEAGWPGRWPTTDMPTTAITV